MNASLPTPELLFVGVDGSEADAHVADTALAAAADLGAKIVLVRAIDMASDDDDATPATPAHAALQRRVAERTHEVESALAAERARLVARGEGRVDVTTRLLDRHPFESLIDAANGTERSWIVVGARRTKSVLGRTVDLVLRRATRPVLVVPDGASWAGNGPVIAGIDAGDLDEIVLRTADETARRLRRRLGIVHVRTNGDESAMLRVTEHARQVAADIAASATISVMRVERSIARTLSDHCRRVGASMLVVGTHGRRAIERWVLGSTAESLVHDSPLPFLVVRRP